jgi:hypothetical protein
MKLVYYYCINTYCTAGNRLYIHAAEWRSLQRFKSGPASLQPGALLLCYAALYRSYMQHLLS